MPTYPIVVCKNCGCTFESQIKIDPAVYAMCPNLKVGNNNFTCPHCNAVHSYSEKDFQYTRVQAKELASLGKIVQNIINVVQQSDNPLKRATEMFEEFETAKKAGSVEKLHESPWLKALQKWLPDTPEKLAAYIVIIQIIIQLLTREPERPVEFNTVINQYYQTSIDKTANPRDEFLIPKQKIGRNDLCPCGSGIKFKKCHGKD